MNILIIIYIFFSKKNLKKYILDIYYDKRNFRHLLLYKNFFKNIEFSPFYNIFSFYILKNDN